MKLRNIFLIFINVFLVLLVILTNYFVDPYFLLRKNNSLHIDKYLFDEPYLPLNMHKDDKYKYVVIGGSTVNCLKLYNYDKNIADLSTYGISLEDMKTMLFDYLDTHKETKYVFIPIDYRQIAGKPKKNFSMQKNYKNPDTFYRLFVSVKTLKYSFIKLFVRVPEYKARIVKYKVQLVTLQPDEIEKKVKKTYGEIFARLRKDNIKAICYILPIHANRMIYLRETIGDETLLNIKKYIISENGYLIDFAVLNKYSAKPLKDSFYLFSDVIHPSDIYGYFVYNILFDKPNKDKDLYEILTKDNVKKSYIEQSKKLNIWEENHRGEYEYYFEGEKLNKINKLNKTLKDVPSPYNKILHYKKSLFYKI